MLIQCIFVKFYIPGIVWHWATGGEDVADAGIGMRKGRA